MAAAAIQIAITGVAASRLVELQSKLANMAPVMAEIGDIVAQKTRLNFVKGQDPDGNVWAPLSAATLRKKRRGTNAKPLRDTGRLMNSITSRNATQNSVEIGTNVIYAAIHQFGGTAGKNHRATIPARPFFPVDDLPKSYRNTIRSALLRWLDVSG